MNSVDWCKDQLTASAGPVKWVDRHTTRDYNEF